MSALGTYDFLSVAVVFVERRLLVKLASREVTPWTLPRPKNGPICSDSWRRRS